jgi:hypothetical protein
MSEPRGGAQARTFHDALTSRAVPEAPPAGADDPAFPPAPPETQPEGNGSPPPAWAGTEPAHPPAPEPAPVPPMPSAAPVEIPNNIMLHGYRTLAREELELLAEVKDLALALWNTLKQIDQSPAAEGAFYARTLGEAGRSLEMCVLWTEKFFLG